METIVKILVREDSKNTYPPKLTLAAERDMVVLTLDNPPRKIKVTADVLKSAIKRVMED